MMMGGVALAAAAGGCQPQPSSATRPTTAQVVGEIPADVLMVRGPSQDEESDRTPRSPADARPATADRTLVGLDAYLISVPAGAVSRNEEFWKRINEEDAVASPAQYDLLRRNGVRVGQGRLEDWAFFKEIIDRRPAATQLFSFVAVAGKSVEMEMKKDVASESVWYFDRGNRLVGRTHENCQNLWSLAYQPVPRYPDHVRVAMTPLIRSQRKRLEVVTRRARPEDPPQREIAYVNPEYLFDLAMEADVPPGKFLVVAPSEEATGGTIGEAFMVGEGLGQQVEKVMLLVPRAVTGTMRAVPADR
jgi:hypothetical protein